MKHSVDLALGSFPDVPDCAIDSIRSVDSSSGITYTAPTTLYGWRHLSIQHPRHFYPDLERTLYCHLACLYLDCVTVIFHGGLDDHAIPIPPRDLQGPRGLAAWESRSPWAKRFAIARHDSGQMHITEAFAVLLNMDPSACILRNARGWTTLGYYTQRVDGSEPGVPSQVLRWNFDWSQYPAEYFSSNVYSYLEGGGWGVEVVKNGDGKYVGATFQRSRGEAEQPQMLA